MSGHLPPIHPSAPPLPYPPGQHYESASAPPNLPPHSPGGGGHHGSHLGGHRPSDGRPYPGHGPPPPPMGDSLPRFGSEYEMGSPALDPLRAGHRMEHMMHGGPHPPHPHAGHLPAHKRAYRQRRKDPSCDACRERKVKCDATDTSSCSECSSRNVKCQFTKETNRRMSSLKQVQDLEKQLLAAKQQVSHYRSLVGGGGAAVDDEESSPGSSSPVKRRKLSHQNYLSIQDSMREQAEGILSIPISAEESLSPSTQPPALPQRDVAEQLMRQFESTLQSALPFLPWAMLGRLIDRVYQEESLRDLPSDTAALFFGCLACGALSNGVEDAQPYFDSLHSLLDFWNNTPSLNLIRAAVLGSVFLIEANQRGRAFLVIGFAARKAQDMGLHRRTGMFSLYEDEQRQKLWAAIFWVERMLSLELGRPSMLAEDEPFPLGARGFSGSPSDPRQGDPLEPMLQVAGVIPQAQKVFRSSVAPTMTLAAIDERLLTLLSPYVRDADTNPSQPPSHASMWMTIYIYSTQLMLHRHNYSPASPPEVKQAALECCTKVASDTARLLLRVGGTPPNSPVAKTGRTTRFDDAIRQGPTSLLALHLWRSIMYLVYSFDFEGAMICARLSSRIGAFRPINRACGRYLEFFLDTMTKKLRQNRSGFLEDEELIAFLSSDLQNNLDQAWIWTSVDRNSPRGAQTNGIPAAAPDAHRQWDNWPGILAMIQALTDEYRSSVPRSADTPSNVTSQAPSLPGAPSSKVSSRPNTAATSTSAVSPASANNRVSIADLMG